MAPSTTLAPTTTVPPTTTTEAPTTTVAKTTTTTEALSAEAAYIEFSKNASFYDGESDAQIAEQGEFGCLLFEDMSVDEFVVFAASPEGGLYQFTAEELEGMELMAAAYCPEVL